MVKAIVNKKLKLKSKNKTKLFAECKYTQIR